MPRKPLRLLLPTAVLSSCAACATGATSDPAPVVSPSRIVNPCDAIRLPARLDDAHRAQLADEIAAAPAGAVWPNVLTDAAGVERGVRACQGAK